ncbi:hypothetical protein [Pontibacillus marinus]|uniref:Tissue inhibitor of metalloproteinase n=1 Tax=Pontibacillus marinus BH030004 = DSM 16465 TaxID=1385511 RepID=A0A0A5HQN3_9BACI|nr:hypothetical protein [Pontibacillus marinus]KGX85927.1 hypothetical protein N783_13120 [Pontibacillus marinus BH030004 = DSM 16465]
MKVNGFVKYISLFITMMFLVLSSFSNTSYACSCAEPGTPKEELEKSDAIFSGKVINMHDAKKNDSIKSSGDPIAVLLEVDRSWKGVDETQVIVYTARASATCGYEFNLNEEYLVYAREVKGELKVSYCSRTENLLQASEDVIALGGENIELEEVSLEFPPENYIILRLLVITGITVSIVIIFKRLIRKMRNRS